jgi:molybdopterin/thiamine biosynthesis adenylyltransferase
MQKQSKDLLYYFPRSLGLAKVKRIGNGQFRLSLGYSDRLRTDLEVDAQGLDLIRTCFIPRTSQELAKKFNLEERNILDYCTSLVEAGVLRKIQCETPTRFKRYDRHLLFYSDAGVDPATTQEKIAKSRVALIGMGGIGNWVSLSLIGAGLGELRLIDFDVIEESNLTRQVLFDESDIGQSKTSVARAKLAAKNSQTMVTEYHCQVTNADTLEELLRGVDFVVLSADRPEKIHDWVDEVCIKHTIPYLNIGYQDGVGVIGPMTIKGETSCYQCFKPNPNQSLPIRNEEEELVYKEFDNRYQAPSFGPLNALVATMGSLEILKYLGKFGSLDSFGTELHIDPLHFGIHRTQYKRDPNCWNCSSPRDHR